MMESESTVFECFPDELLYVVHPDPWYANIVNYLVAGKIPEDWTRMIEIDSSTL